MWWFVYIVECSDGSYYVGICYNLKNRIAAHNSGKYKGAYTKGRLPVRLVYWERFGSRIGAAKREKEIKGWSHAKKLSLVNSFANQKRTFNKLVNV